MARDSLDNAEPGKGTNWLTVSGERLAVRGEWLAVRGEGRSSLIVNL